jgi:hypothetical protein
MLSLTNHPPPTGACPIRARRTASPLPGRRATLRTWTLLAAAAVTTILPSGAFAQDGNGAEATVQDILGFLVTNQGVQTGDFEKDQEAAQATRDTLTRALLSSVATLPVTTSSGGFTYRFNPTLGTVERASETFGPFYVERALTAGAGQASMGFTFQRASFRSIDGNDLRNGELITVANQFDDEPEPFDVETLTLEMSSSTATFFANLGVGNRVDLGVAVPLVRLSIDGSRLNNYRGQALLQARARATSVGLADIAVRSKVRLTPSDRAGALSAGVEARLPTGREEDLLGAGDLALRFMGIASYEANRAGVYGNFIVGTGGLGREVSYGGAVSVAATPRVTLVGEVMWRRLAGIRAITEVVEPHPRIQGVLTTRLVPGGEDETTSFTVAGFKWNMAATWLLHGHVLIPLSSNGLTTRFTPTVSLDYSFAR